jgi:hypothetical protein
VEHTESSSVEPLSPAVPGRRQPLELAARIMSIAMLGWLCALAVFAWIAYDEGLCSLLLPIWNSVFVLGMLPIVQGVFARRLWGQRWVVGISVFTALGNGMQAARVDSEPLWFGCALLVAVAVVVKLARPLFNDSDGNQGRIQRLIATIVTIGSIVVGLQTMYGGPGTERGRELFAREVQANYDKVGAGAVRVYVNDVNLVIESKSDTPESLDAGAEALHAQLVAVGPRAKAWAVGFHRIILTNGSYQRVLTPDLPPGRAASAPRQ